MIRQGKYTKPVSKLTLMKNSARRRWVWFKGLSKRKKAMLIAGPILLFLVLTPPLTYLYFAHDIANAERLMNHNSTGVVLLDRNGEPFYSFGTAERGKRLPLDQIADSAEKALISAEDKNFYEHQGFSFTGIVAALYANIINGDPTAYGGSTITQQLAKNTLLSSNQNFLRKYQELSIAIAIEQHYTKDEILDMYLNSVYFGEGAFGIQAAAKNYFNKSAADLTLAESSMLIGLLPAPSAYSPLTGDPELAKKQQEKVLERMADNGAITDQESTAALAQTLAYSEEPLRENDKAQHFAQMVIEELNERYGEERVTRSGYRVKTTLDLSAQAAAKQAVDDQINYIIRNGGSNAAVVAMDPKSGGIIAYVGSADWNNEEFGKVNMASTPRQPGSSFKPIYFTRALQDGVVTPSTILRDEATTFGGSYKPENYDFRYRGDISVRNALAQSLNIPAVKVLDKLGVDKAIDTARDLGLETIDQDKNYGLSLALGAAEVELTDMTNAYAAFANGGGQYEATSIQSIDDKFGDRIYTYKPSKKQAVSDGSAYLISKILSDNGARAPTFGGSLNISGYDVAVKTGTTDDSRDAWTMGYAPNIAVGVWVGNNDNTVMRLGGSTMAGPIWMDTITSVLERTDKQSFEQPASVTQMLVCRSNGQKATRAGAGTYNEYFIRGKTPTGMCDVPVEKKEEVKPREEEEEKPEELPVPDPNDTPEEDEEEEPTTPLPGTDNGQDDGTDSGSENDGTDSGSGSGSGGTTQGQGGGRGGGTTTPSDEEEATSP